MSYWNYRVIQKEHLGQNVDLNERCSFGIYEVYYDDNGNITSCTIEPMDPYGTTVDDLKECLTMMQKAFSFPVLDYEKDILSSDLHDNVDSATKLDDIMDDCDAQDGC